MSGIPHCTCFKKKATFSILNFLLGCNGIPFLPAKKQLLCVKFMYSFLRKVSLVFLNLYLIYRVLKVVKHRDITFDLFPLINAGVSACTVNSIALQYQKFNKFSSGVSELLHKHNTYLSGRAFLKLAVFYMLFLSYVLVCALVFPATASHWFDTADNLTDDHDVLHMPQVKPFTHAVIFLMCSGGVVTSIMLYSFVCVLLQQLLHSIYIDIKNLQSEDVIQSSCIHEFRARFIETANVIRLSDEVFSLFGLVGLGCVFARACACIHFYLQVTSMTSRVTWLFIATQISFDMSALTAVCCFAASVSEEALRIPPMVMLVINRIPPKNIGLHFQCLNFAKVILSYEVRMTAWKLFPFSRRVLPTVIGVTLSYITVIIQMHHAASMGQRGEKFAFNSNLTKPIIRYY